MGLAFNEKCVIILSYLIKMKRKKKMEDKKRPSDWLTIIPILFWVLCIAISLAKLCQSGNEIHIIDCIEIFNSNTFSTFISMVICMAYKYFTVPANKQEIDSGLSRKWIWLTIMATVIYGMFSVANASRYCLATSVIMAIASVIYVVLFFKVMRK